MKYKKIILAGGNSYPFLFTDAAHAIKDILSTRI
jgi:hypothetical protein